MYYMDVPMSVQDTTDVCMYVCSKASLYDFELKYIRDHKIFINYNILLQHTHVYPRSFLYSTIKCSYIQRYKLLIQPTDIIPYVLNTYAIEGESMEYCNFTGQRS